MVQFLRERVRVTEYREGCIFKTQSLGLHWTSDDQTYQVIDDMFWASISTKEMVARKFKTTRIVPDGTQDVKEGDK